LQTVPYEKPVLPELLAKDTLNIQAESNEVSQTNPTDSNVEEKETNPEIQKDSTVFEPIVVQRIPYSSLNEEELQAMKPLNDSKPLQLEAIIIDTVESGSKFELNDLLFKTDSYTLFEESKSILNLFAIYLTSNPEYFIKIEGHTDDIGDARSNLLLSQKRAQEVKKYLISKNISTDRLQAKGYGEQKPKVPNSSNENRRINRRTECQIIIR